MSASWQQWKRHAIAKEKRKPRKNIVEIRIGPIDIGCKWKPAFDERYEVCIYHGEQRKRESEARG